MALSATLLSLGLATPTAVDRANRCSPLPARPAAARIIHSDRPVAAHALPSSWTGVVAQLRVDDELIVAAPVGLALRSPCRQLVAELGEVSRVTLAGGSATTLHAWKPIVSSAYGGAAVELSGRRGWALGEVEAAEAEAADEGGEEAAAYCDVLFTRGQTLRRVARTLAAR